MDKHLTTLEHQLKSDSTDSDSTVSLDNCLAKSMLVMMVRGLFTGLQFPYANFPCTSLRGDQIFRLFWKAVARLERYGFSILCVTCDGLSANRHFFRMHNHQKSRSDLIYKTPNPYSKAKNYIFFISDPPHLMKTTRNCFASKTRSLWVSLHYTCQNKQ